MPYIITKHRIKMVVFKFEILSFAALLLCTSVAYGWGSDGHLITCKLAQPRLSAAAADAVSRLLPSYANNDLGSVCSWADEIRFRYQWSSPLHYIDTPDNLCTYGYDRDCKDEDGAPSRCVAGAINNYTDQLLSYGSGNSASQYNLTEALLFLSHFMGDIHQPLHVGFTSDRGGNTIDVHWYTRAAVLHHTVWANQAEAWEALLCAAMQRKESKQRVIGRITELVTARFLKMTTSSPAIQL